MRILGPVVGMAANLPPLLVTQFAHRSWIGLQAVGNDGFRSTMPLQRLLEEPQSGRFIAFPGDIAFEHLALVIDRAPQVMHLTVDLHINLVDVPLPVAKAAHPAYPLTSDISREHWPESVPPQTNGLVTQVDASFEQQFLHISQRQRKPHVHHDHEADYLGR